MENKRLDLSNSQLKWETLFKKILITMSVLLVLIILGVLATLILESMPSIKSMGIGFLWGKVWDPVSNVYGAYPFPCRYAVNIVHSAYSFRSFQLRYRYLPGRIQSQRLVIRPAEKHYRADSCCAFYHLWFLGIICISTNCTYN